MTGGGATPTVRVIEYHVRAAGCAPSPPAHRDDSGFSRTYSTPSWTANSHSSRYSRSSASEFGVHSRPWSSPAAASAGTVATVTLTVTELITESGCGAMLSTPATRTW